MNYKILEFKLTKKSPRPPPSTGPLTAQTTGFESFLINSKSSI